MSHATLIAFLINELEEEMEFLLQCRNSCQCASVLHDQEDGSGCMYCALGDRMDEIDSVIKKAKGEGE